MARIYFFQPISVMYFSEGLHEQCGVFAIRTQDELATLKAKIGTDELVHRGQTSCGFDYRDVGGEIVPPFLSSGPSHTSFRELDFESMKSHFAMGHNRYGTQGDRQDLRYAHPQLYDSPRGSIAVMFNGHIANAMQLKKEMESGGIVFGLPDSDLEVLGKLIASYENPLDGFRAVREKAIGSYAIVVLTREGIYAMRDPHGIKPISIGVSEHDIAVASESCAFDELEMELDRDIKPASHRRAI